MQREECINKNRKLKWDGVRERKDKKESWRKRKNVKGAKVTTITKKKKKKNNNNSSRNNMREKRKK